MECTDKALKEPTLPKSDDGHPMPEILCTTCGKPVEKLRECYVTPTCYACLPPPEKLPEAEPPMPETKPTPMAFPLPGYDPGMTLRDWFAGQALIGWWGPDDKQVTAVMAYRMADAMMQARGEMPREES